MPADADANADGLTITDDPTVLKRRSVHGAAATFVAQGLRFLVQFGSQIYLAHLVAPAEFGLVAMAAPVIGFVQFFNQLGLVEATIQRPTITPRELTALFWVNVLASLALCALLILVSPAIGWFYGEPRTVGIVVVLTLPLLLNGVAAQHMAVMNRRMRFVPLAAIDVASTVAAAAVGIGGAWAGLGYWSLVAMQVANSACLLAMAWGLSGWRPGRPRREAGMGSLLRFGGDVTGHGLLEYLTTSLDNVLIGAVSGTVALGLYDRAWRLMLMPLIQATMPFARIAVPLLSRLQDDEARYRRAYLQLLEASLLLVTPGVVFAIVMADAIVVHLLGPVWRDAGPILAWLGVAGLAGPVNMSTGWLFISQNRTRPQLVWGSLAACIILASFVAGLPWGPTGVAAASAVATWALKTPILCWSVTRRGPVRARHLAGACAPVAAGALVLGAALWAARERFQFDSLPLLAGLLALSYAAQGVAMLALPAGQRILRDVWALRTTFRRAPA